jgi:cytochrome oxidase Cu insertion factor (SCO1/SenC/PrrC family)
VLRTRLTLAFFLGFGILAPSQERPRVRPLPAASKGMQTGPEVGQPIPEFSLIDQSGKQQSFATLKGKSGLVLAIVRSADW